MVVYKPLIPDVCVFTMMITWIWVAELCHIYGTVVRLFNPLLGIQKFTKV